MAVAGAVATKTRGVAANDSQATRGASAGKGTTVASQAWDSAAPYKREYCNSFIYYFMQFYNLQLSCYIICYVKHL